jgi:hypothetical protein
MMLFISDDHLNELQKRSIAALLEAVKGAHYIDVMVRKGGKDLQFQADWLRHLERRPSGVHGPVTS